MYISKYPYTVVASTEKLDRSHNFTSYHNSSSVHLYTSSDYWDSIVAITIDYHNKNNKNNNINKNNRRGNYNTILTSAMEAGTKKNNKKKSNSNATSTTIRFSAYNAPHIDSSAKVLYIIVIIV